MPTFMKTQPAFSSTKRRVSAAYGLLTSLSLIGCGTRDEVDASTTESGFAEPETASRPTFGQVAGGQSGVEGEMRCEPDFEVIDLETTPNGAKFSPAELLELVAGPHETTLAYEGITLPGEDIEDGTAVSIEVISAGEARYLTDCADAIEVDVTVKLISADGTLDLEAPAVVSAHSLASALLKADFSLNQAQAWAAPLTDATGSNDLKLRLTANFTDSGTAGSLLVVKGSKTPAPTCELARWPADSRCERHERAVSATTLFEGLVAEYLTDAFNELSPRSFQWDDETSTELSFTFTPEGEDVCILKDSWPCDDSCGWITYSVPGTIELSTADARIHLSVPARLGTDGTSGNWRALQLTTSGAVTLADAAVLDFGFAELSSGQRVVINAHTSTGIDDFGMRLWLFEPNSGVTLPQTNPCIEMMGTLTDVMSGSAL